MKAPKECVSGNKHQQIPSNPDSFSYAHMHTQAPSTSQETKLEAWEKDGRPLAPCLAPCIQLREVTEESLCPPAPLPYSRCVRPSPPASIILRTSWSRSQAQANALERMFQFKIKLIWKNKWKGIESKKMKGIWLSPAEVGVKTRSVKGIALRVSITNPLCSTAGQVERVCMCAWVLMFLFQKTKWESYKYEIWV